MAGKSAVGGKFQALLTDPWVIFGREDAASCVVDRRASGDTLAMVAEGRAWSFTRPQGRGVSREPERPPMWAVGGLCHQVQELSESPA